MADARFTADGIARLLASAESIAARAAATLVAMQAGELEVELKERRDVVTAADLASERLVIEGLRALTPDAAILSEEAGLTGPAGGARWIVDPLDGTVNYASGLPWFSVTLAYQERGETLIGVTHAPRADLVARYTREGLADINGRRAQVSAATRLDQAVVSVVLTSHFSDLDVARTVRVIERLAGLVRGVRIVVSGALEMTLVAAGQLDGFVSLKADIVSHAGAMPLVRAAGGRVSTLSGADCRDEDLEKIASNGLIHDALLRAIA